VSGAGTALGSIRTTVIGFGGATTGRRKSRLGARFGSGSGEGAPASTTETAVKMSGAIGAGVGLCVGDAGGMSSGGPFNGDIYDGFEPRSVVVVRPCGSFACTEEYAKRNAPKPSPESISNERKTMVADAAPVGNEMGSSANWFIGSEDDGGGGGIKKPRGGDWFIMISAVQCEN